MGQFATVAHGPLDTLLVQPERVIDDAFFRRETFDHFVRVGPTGNPLRINERRHLDFLQSSLGERIDQFDLPFRGDRSFLDLKTFAGAFFLNIDFLWQITHRSLLRSNCANIVFVGICVRGREIYRANAVKYPPLVGVIRFRATRLRIIRRALASPRPVPRVIHAPSWSTHGMRGSCRDRRG